MSINNNKEWTMEKIRKEIDKEVNKIKNKNLTGKHTIHWKNLLYKGDYQEFGIFECPDCRKTIYIYVKSITLLDSYCPYCHPYTIPFPVFLESPYAGETQPEIDRHTQFARACMKDCLNRGEAPFASHLLYTQPGILHDSIPEERRKGIEAGLSWGKLSRKTVVYCNLGITKGMIEGIKRARNEGRAVEKRLLPGYEIA